MKETEKTLVMVEADLKERMLKLAKSERRTLSAQVNIALEEYLSRVELVSKSGDDEDM